ncbi:MAG: hypothetical protein D6772_12370 [Bacteroidetes bacterium]|nr:MAG: hypothetical protein D6772_12370 [Bacteroidota bacterium]
MASLKYSAVHQQLGEEKYRVESQRFLFRKRYGNVRSKSKAGKGNILFIFAAHDKIARKRAFKG